MGIGGGQSEDGDTFLSWEEGGELRHAMWKSISGSLPPKRILVVDDRLTADAAFRHAAEGTALLWRGDFQNARQLLHAMKHRIDRRQKKPPPPEKDIAGHFHHYRLARAQRAQLLGKLLLPFDPDGRIPLRRAPDVREACRAAWAVDGQAVLAPLRDVQGLIGAFEWRAKGVFIEALGARIHPYFGVFSPIRGEYVDLVANAPMPHTWTTGMDIGTGTGVLAAVLAKRGLHVLASDSEGAAITCAEENIRRLGLADTVQVMAYDMFPPGQADVIVCNPPWLPGKARTPLERAVYDPDSRMLRRFVAGARAHLTPGGEAWLILSDLAEHLQLRSREELGQWIDAGGLRVIDRLDTHPKHPKVADSGDLLHFARRRETTSLWRFAAA